MAFLIYALIHTYIILISHNSEGLICFYDLKMHNISVPKNATRQLVSNNNLFLCQSQNLFLSGPCPSAHS